MISTFKNQIDEKISKPQIANAQIKLTQDPNIETERLCLPCFMHRNLDLYPSPFNLGTSIAFDADATGYDVLACE